jgi:hypothetical protein
MPRSNLKIKVGKYTGNGIDGTAITGIGFRPDLVIIKQSTNNAVFRTKERRGDSTGFLASTNTDLTDRIQTMLNDGFEVGTTAQVNTNGLTYYYLAIKGDTAQKYFSTFNYFGDGADNRNVTTTGISFTPDIVVVQAISGAVAAVHKTSAMVGDTATKFDSSGTSNLIQNLQSLGFQLGTSTGVNAAGVEHFGFALKSYSGRIAVGTYTGTGVARSITGIGFTPDFVLVKNYSVANQARLLTSTMVSDALTSLFMGTTATDANGITSLDTDGFTVGTGTDVNGSGNTCYWIALKSGNFKTPLSRLTA